MRNGDIPPQLILFRRIYSLCTSDFMYRLGFLNFSGGYVSEISHLLGSAQFLTYPIFELISFLGVGFIIIVRMMVRRNLIFATHLLLNFFRCSFSSLLSCDFGARFSKVDQIGTAPLRNSCEYRRRPSFLPAVCSS